MKPTPQIKSNQFPVQIKKKPTVWALLYNGQEQIKGNYSLCVFKQNQLLKGGGVGKNLFKIVPVEFEK